MRGVAPYLKSLMLQNIKNHDHYVLLFHESLNLKTQSKQMDINDCLWHNHNVCTRYLTSEFVGNATALDLLTCSHNSISGLNPARILHVVHGAFVTVAKKS